MTISIALDYTDHDRRLKPTSPLLLGKIPGPSFQAATKNKVQRYLGSDAGFPFGNDLSETSALVSDCATYDDLSNKLKWEAFQLTQSPNSNVNSSHYDAFSKLLDDQSPQDEIWSKPMIPGVELVEWAKCASRPRRGSSWIMSTQRDIAEEQLDVSDSLQQDPRSDIIMNESVTEPRQICDACGSSFRGKDCASNLRRHKKTIHGSKKYQCQWDVCDHSCNRHDNLSKHVKAVHVHWLEQKTCSWVCDGRICGVTCGSPDLLEQHVHAFHVKSYCKAIDEEL